MPQTLDAWLVTMFLSEIRIELVNWLQLTFSEDIFWINTKTFGNEVTSKIELHWNIDALFQLNRKIKSSYLFQYCSVGQTKDMK